MIKRLYPAFVFILLCLIVMTITCGGLDESIYDPEFNVYGILYNGYSFQQIIVERTYRLDEPSEPSLDDALVILSADEMSDTFAFLAGNPSTYIAWDLSIQPATTYELMVIKEGLDTLYGITTVPSDFIIQNPEYDTLTLSDTVVFTRSHGAAVYMCTCGYDYTGYRVRFLYYPDPVDTIETLVLGNYFYDIPSGFYPFTIDACDSNYFKYTWERTDSVYAAGVTGGLGLFGSSWTVSKQFYIIAE
jgi:hypothetical protein